MFIGVPLVIPDKFNPRPSPFAFETGAMAVVELAFAGVVEGMEMEGTTLEVSEAVAAAGATATPFEGKPLSFGMENLGFLSAAEASGAVPIVEAAAEVITGSGLEVD